MKISEAWQSLENSWSREIVLSKINKGIDPEAIINEFFHGNQDNIKIIRNSLKNQDIELLENIEKLSTCEAKLINRLKNSTFSAKKSIQQFNSKSIKDKLLFKLAFFMTRYSNKFVFISLTTISAIALTKQAWA